MPAQPSEESDGPRLWAGTTLADRRAARRESLLDAGLDLLGAEQPGGLSVRAACRRAGLTERYFYESFPDRDAFVLAVYDRVADEARSALQRATGELSNPAEVARAAVEAMVTLMLDDPRKGRVLLVVPLTEHQLADRGVRALPGVVAMVRDQLSPEASATDRELIATGYVGALMGLFHAFVAGQLDVTRGEFVDHCVRLLRTAPRLESGFTGYPVKPAPPPRNFTGGAPDSLGTQ